MTRGTHCLVCGSAPNSPIIDLPPVPTDTNRMYSSRESAKTAPKAPISLAQCRNCDHVFNRRYNNDLVNYEEGYENSQMFSPLFRKYCEDLSDQLITKHGLRHKHIVEIGGGRGDFLRIICERGENLGVSFDPSYRPKPDDDIPRNLHFTTDYYAAKYAREPADLIVCRHVLEHLCNPRDLITTVRKAVGDRHSLIVYFEVPNGDYILREQALWELHYQHCSYFTKASIIRLFAECGFRMLEVQEHFGGQFLAIQACASIDLVNLRALPRSCPSKSATAELCEVFGTAFRGRLQSWLDRLDHLRAERKRVVAWGAGAKGVTFLNLVNPSGDVISHVVDLNPRKAGRFVPGSAQEIIPPEALRELCPEVVILMNGIYRQELGSVLAVLGLNPTLLVA